MRYWQRAPMARGQMQLFPKRLDEAIAHDHPVRLFDMILGQIDWSVWEERYKGYRGRPPIHPRVLAGVLLYGSMTRIRSSRALEEALQVRIDFLWLGEGRSIDHTTLSEFRRKFEVELKDLFVQIGMVAKDLNFLSLSTLAFDGTRIRANNRRRGTRTREDLEKMRSELEAKYAAYEAKVAEQDDHDEETFSSTESDALTKEGASVKDQQAKVAAALAELDRAKEAGEKVPTRIPLTDPESRKTPNKEGGFAANYTPTATVDVESGMLVSVDVIAGTDENRHMCDAIADVRASFDLEKDESLDMLADGLMCTGENLAAMEEEHFVLYSPSDLPDPSTNPAVRDDPTQPVPEDQWDALPTGKIGGKNEKRLRLTKWAFVYDEASDCYWCPMGRTLKFKQVMKENRQGRKLVRRRYRSQPETCEACPLRERCLAKNGKRREVCRDQHEELRESHARRMATDDGQKKYAQRRHAGERPFAEIKERFGARRFLLRGLKQVRMEWMWLATAFNLRRLMSLLRSRAGPNALA